jgi:hypothetical protein
VTERAFAPVVLALLFACTIAPGPGPGASPTGAGGLPEGFGTLSQEDVSLTLSSGDLRLMVTPLHVSVAHVTAPDTEQRLAALVAAHATPGTEDGAGLFLISFFSDRPDTRFDPDEVQLVSRGFRHRPVSISPLTPTWGERRLGQREQTMAVYRYSGTIDLEADLVLAYGPVQSAQWSVILPRIQAERARARARAGLPGD